MPFVAVECGVPAIERALFGEADGVRAARPRIADDRQPHRRRARRHPVPGGRDRAARRRSGAPRAASRATAKCGSTASRCRSRSRLLASASPGIEADVQTHRFRSDLYRRLAALRIDLPPLRERAEDVPALAAAAARGRGAPRDGIAPRAFTQTALALLAALIVAGQPRRAARRRRARRGGRAARRDSDRGRAAGAALRPRAHGASCPSGNLREARLRFERDYIAAVLQHHGWRMADAAQTLGIQRPNLYRKARQLGIPLARASE